MNDMGLLREYATRHSEAAFEELVKRRIGFVYAAALRQVREPHLAEDVTQAVFVILAQKAGKISAKTILAGWLFKTTRFTAFAQIRAATKRSLRVAALEKELQMQTEFQSAANETWDQMSPLLDEALAALGKKDRQAVLLRFFENKPLAEVGKFLGIEEDTARKRVGRALEKLRRYFSKRGISSTTAIIAGEISANSIQAAPVALAKTVTAVAVAKGAAASTSTLTLFKGALKLMAWTKAKTAVVAGVVVLLAATSTTVIGIRATQAHRMTAEPVTGLSPIVQMVTADIQPDGTILFQMTVEATNNTSRTISADNINDVNLISRAKDESGKLMRTTKRSRGGTFVVLNKAVPPGGTTSYTVEGKVAGFITKNNAGEYQLETPCDIGNVTEAHLVQVWRLPAGATLLGKGRGMDETTNAGRIELRIDRIIPPNGSFSVAFRYRLAVATN